MINEVCALLEDHRNMDHYKYPSTRYRITPISLTVEIIIHHYNIIKLLLSNIRTTLQLYFNNMNKIFYSVRVWLEEY